MRKMTKERLTRLADHGYTVVLWGDDYALVRRYSVNSRSFWKRYWPMYTLVKQEKRTQE